MAFCAGGPEFDSQLRLQILPFGLFPFRIALKTLMEREREDGGGSEVSASWAAALLRSNDYFVV